LIEYWVNEAEEALEVASHLIEKRDYSYALFFGHLAIEKILKALHVAKLKNHAVPGHNLIRLAKAAGLELDKEKLDLLVTITAFNIEAGYPDTQRTFRKKCTPGYSKSEMKTIRELFLWLKSQLPS
jgi:HEPN domain-containing protein